MNVTFRPLPAWPHKPTTSRQYARFETSYPRTLQLLEREVGYLGGRDVVMGVGLTEFDIRQDGKPRANARSRIHPGVEVSFDSRDHGRLTYATDQYTDWQDNVRAIALSLEALRAVERWGVSKGRQYAGFSLLTAGVPLEQRGRELVEQYGSVKDALRATHPGHGRAHGVDPGLPGRAGRAGRVVIRDIVRQAWERDPVMVLLSIPAAILTVLVIWLVLIVAIVAGTPA